MLFQTGSCSVSSCSVSCSFGLLGLPFLYPLLIGWFLRVSSPGLFVDQRSLLSWLFLQCLLNSLSVFGPHTSVFLEIFSFNFPVWLPIWSLVRPGILFIMTEFKILNFCLKSFQCLVAIGSSLIFFISSF